MGSDLSGIVHLTDCPPTSNLLLSLSQEFLVLQKVALADKKCRLLLWQKSFISKHKDWL